MAVDEKLIDRMFAAGAHYGYSRSRRHPSVSLYLFGAKGSVELFDLEKTSSLLSTAKEFIAKLASEGKVILFVGGKAEGRDAVRKAAERLAMPHVTGRWIGGTLTNFGEIKKRIERMKDLTEKREKGELAKFTKLERLLIDREIEELEKVFGGIKGLTKTPDALLVIDPKREHTAVAEAVKMKVSIVALLNSDCNAREVNYPVIGNDAAMPSISFFVEELTKAYEDARREAPQAETLATAEVK